MKYDFNYSFGDTITPAFYLVIGLLIVGIFCALAVFIVSKIIKKKHESPEYIEEQKKKPTTQAHVAKVAKILELTKEEEALLWKVCRDTKADNILYSYTDDDYVESIFKQEFHHLMRSHAGDELVYAFFHLRFHIYKIVNYSRYITSSHNIPAGTVLSYPAPSGFQYQFTLVKNEENGLLLTVPDTMDDECEDKPAKLQKLAMVFSLANGQQYAILTRVVQFLTTPNNEKVLLVTHSNTVCPQSRRTSMRFAVNRDCSFSAVDVTQKADGNVSLKAKENCYDGTIVDLSEGGCKLFTTLPIKQKQYIYLRFEILGRQEGIFGQIADTRTDYDSGMYSIHIAFKQVPLDTKVRLLSDLYDYGSN